MSNMDTNLSPNPESAGDKGSGDGKKSASRVGLIILACVLACIVCLIIGFLYVARSMSRDCYWSAEALAFEDSNTDGVYQEGETPLEGVELTLIVLRRDGTQKGSESQFVTGKDGKVEVGTFLPGCPDVKFRVIAQAPEEYKLTTPSEFETDNYFLEDPIPFGFTPTKLIVTPTP